jgi:hypothetical protein
MASDEADLDGQIAIIGMAGRFPGARDLDTFWSNLRNGVEAVQFYSEEELLATGELLENIRDPAYVRASAPLDDIDQFDAAFFGMSPRDAAVFDPQHRLFLECAWEAFEHAGYVGERVDGSVGVFASCGLSEYMFKNVLANEHVATSVGEWLVRHTGNDTNFLATRVSYELDLHGPSLNVQTACSSTLVAVHLACQSLLSGECDVALAGGAVVDDAGAQVVAVADLLGGETLERTVTWRHRPTTTLDPETGQGDAHVQFAFAAHRAVVDVDVELGLVKVVALDCAQDVGHAVNPSQVVGQIHGGSAQGLGLAVMEEIQVVDGLVRNPSFTDYLIPTVLDMPPMRVDVLELADPHAPYGLRGVGEPPTISSTPAVVAAIRAATGLALSRVPVRPGDITGT